jgi:DnaJ-class molecular chaperone
MAVVLHRLSDGDRRGGGSEPVEPAPCPRCGGSGVLGPRDEFGNWDGCGHCEATGIDPEDPAFPA